MVFKNGPYIVCKKVCAGGNRAPCGARAICRCWKEEGFCQTAVAIEFGFDSKKMVEVKCDTTTSTIQGKPAHNIAVLRIESHERIICRDLHPGVVLSRRHGSKQQTGY